MVGDHRGKEEKGRLSRGQENKHRCYGGGKRKNVMELLTAKEENITQKEKGKMNNSKDVGKIQMYNPFV